MSNFYAVFLYKTLPEEFLVVTAGYLRQKDALSYLFASQVQQTGAFLECVLVTSRQDTCPWKIQLPLGYVIAIADMSEDRHRIGFLQE